MWCSGGGGKEGEDRTSRNSPSKGFATLSLLLLLLLTSFPQTLILLSLREMQPHPVTSTMSSSEVDNEKASVHYRSSSFLRLLTLTLFTNYMIC